MLTVVKAQKLNTQHVTENTSKDPIISICQVINEELRAYEQTLKDGFGEHSQDGFGEHSQDGFGEHSHDGFGEHSQTLKDVFRRLGY